MMAHMAKKPEYHFFKSNTADLLKKIPAEHLKRALYEMVLIRNFEIRAESAYQQGKIGGFFHAYIGQEAIQTAAVDAMGIDKNWWMTTYRCHALALLTGVKPKEAMAELYGKASGNARGRGGSMHLYADRMLGGYGIVGGHIPIAAGAAFSLKYKGEKGAAVAFLGDGAVPQGAFHEAMNMMALWNLPAIIVIENNMWGMGTAVSRAVAAQPIAEHFAKAYDIESYTLDGLDYFNCYGGFQEIYNKVLETGRPVLVEAVTQRFRGHSISDPALYRSKDDLKCIMEKDPITKFSQTLLEAGVIREGEFDEMNEKAKAEVLEAMKFADESPLPDLLTLEEDVFAP